MGPQRLSALLVGGSRFLSGTGSPSLSGCRIFLCLDSFSSRRHANPGLGAAFASLAFLPAALASCSGKASRPLLDKTRAHPASFLFGPGGIGSFCFISHRHKPHLF